MKRIRLLVLLLTLFLGGCLLKPWIPVYDGAYAVEDRYAVVPGDSLLMILRPQIYSGESPGAGADYFSLYLRVKNTSSRPITLSASAFNLLADNRQYDHIPLPVVLGGIQNAWLVGRFDDPFADTPLASDDTQLSKARAEYLELVNDYFSFGNILPGATKEGYLFYDSRVDRAKTVTIDALGVPVTFSR